jgi:hypothetical protein
MPADRDPTEEERRITWANAPGWAEEAGWAKPPGYRPGWYAYDPGLDDARPVPAPDDPTVTQYPAPLSLEEADRLAAEEETLQTPPPAPCPVCSGSGDDPVDGSTCPSCGGWGLER